MLQYNLKFNRVTFYSHSWIVSLYREVGNVRKAQELGCNGSCASTASLPPSQTWPVLQLWAPPSSMGTCAKCWGRFCDLAHSLLTVANWLPLMCWHFLAPDTHIKVVHFAFATSCYLKFSSSPIPNLGSVSSQKGLYFQNFSLTP